MKSCPTCRRKFVPSEQSCPLDGAPLAAASGDAPTGVGKQLGPYLLVCLLGEGGMGNIYVGKHSGLGRYVAIKMLRPELANRKDNVSRFFQEADTINSLKHPNIVESLDLVEDVVDGAYCVLELLKGPDLKTRLAKGPLPLDSAVAIGTQLADALGKVHAIGVVHRDLKPENLILIERDGRDDFVKLIDFGIAQIGHQGAGAFGTAAYMAPEQGSKGATVDGRADIYSLGVIMFEMATGRHPFPSATDSEYLIHHADTKVPRPSKLNPKVPPALETVIMKCMAKRPDERYASADQVAAALRMIDARSMSSGRGGMFAAVGVLVAGAAVAAVLVVPKLLDSSKASAEAPQVATSTPPPTPTPTPESSKDAPAPTKQVEPAAPSIVEIDIVSTPKGATVFRAGETIALGVTPFTVPLPRSDKPVEMRFELAGYQAKTIEVPVEGAMEIEVELAKATKSRDPVATKSSVKFTKPAGAEPGEPKPKKQVQREGVIDPFANP